MFFLNVSAVDDYAHTYFQYIDWGIDINCSSKEGEYFTMIPDLIQGFYKIMKLSYPGRVSGEKLKMRIILGF